MNEPTNPVEQDLVNHPQHYGGDTPYECIKVLEAWNIEDFCIGNAIIYLARAGKKTESPIEDYKKAIWYIQRRIEQIKKYQETYIAGLEVKVGPEPIKSDIEVLAQHIIKNKIKL